MAAVVLRGPANTAPEALVGPFPRCTRPKSGPAGTSDPTGTRWRMSWRHRTIPASARRPEPGSPTWYPIPAPYLQDGRGRSSSDSPYRSSWGSSSCRAGSPEGQWCGQLWVAWSWSGRQPWPCSIAVAPA